ncbi:Os01g0114300, partial [Oryza sativa Japonica Group]
FTALTSSHSVNRVETRTYPSYTTLVRKLCTCIFPAMLCKIIESGNFFLLGTIDKNVLLLWLRQEASLSYFYMTMPNKQAI